LKIGQYLATMSMKVPYFLGHLFVGLVNFLYIKTVPTSIYSFRTDAKLAHSIFLE